MVVKVRYPIEPLAAAMGCSLNQMFEQLGVSGSTRKGYRELGVSELVADRLATRAGLVTYLVWPEIADDIADEIRAARNAVEAQRARVRYHRDPEWAALKRKKTRLYYLESRDAILRQRRRQYAENDGAQYQRDRRAAETPEQHEARLQAERDRRSRETPEQRENRLAANRAYKAKRKAALSQP